MRSNETYQAAFLIFLAIGAATLGSAHADEARETTPDTVIDGGLSQETSDCGEISHEDFDFSVFTAKTPEPQTSLSQNVAISVRQSLSAQTRREPEETGCALEPLDWSLPLRADLRWKIDIGETLTLALESALDWRAASGALMDGILRSDEAGEAEFTLNQAELRWAIRQSGPRLVLGKSRPAFGVNYIGPLSAVGSVAEGSEAPWLGGTLLGLGDYAAELYCELSPDPLLIASVSALMGGHELGALYKREDGQGFGAWYRSQIGDSLIPYAEALIRDNADTLELSGALDRGVGWNADALIGLGWTPMDINLSCYLEYRWRQAGYGEKDWAAIRALSPPLRAPLMGRFPYLKSAIHTIGLHLRNAAEIRDSLSWTATAIYLPPDGLYAELGAGIRLSDQLSLGAKASTVQILFGKPDTAESEIPLWPYESRFEFYGSWKIDAAD